MLRAVIFDFDGVLTLDETGSQSICKYIWHKMGIDKNRFKNEYRRYNAGLLSGRLKHEDVWDKICDGISNQIDISEGMVTDNKADRIKSLMDFYQWDRVFDGIAVSANIGSGKETQEIFDWIFETLEVLPRESIFIDNKKENLIIPQNMGVITIF